MKNTLLRLGRLAVYTGLLFGALTNGYGQGREIKDKKFKAARELRELVNKSTAALRTSQADGLQEADLVQVKGSYVVIEAVSNDADGRGLLRQLQALGLKNGSSFGRMVSGMFPINKIDRLEQVEKLRYAAPSYEPMHNVGLVTSQGDVSLGADKARTSLAVTGVGSKVGILSDSYGAIAGGPAAGVASGDLPNDVEVLEDASGFSDEGRAMAEIVHDVAPGAKIAFNTAFLGQASFANGILRLADNGCNIIVDDVFYFAEPFFQDGIIAQAVDQVVDRNVSYFSAAGNQARRSYESGFRNSGQAIIINGVNYGVAHDFGGGDTRQTIIIPASGQLRLALQWADPFFSVSGGAGAQTDLDILVFFNGALAFSRRTDNLGADPFEFLSLNAGTTGATIELVITKVAGPDPQLMKYIEFGNSTIAEFNTTGSTVVGHNNAAKTISVGAAPWFNTPQFNTNITRPVVESFSSLGGTPVFITTTGVNTGIDPSKIRRNPSVVGPDGGNNTFFGSDTSLDPDAFPNFFGTSAAAPHVAAVAALMQQTNGNQLTPQRVRDILTSTALDMDDPFTPGFDTGYDFRTGFGFVRAEQAVNAATDPCRNAVTTQPVAAPDRLVVGAGPLTFTAAQLLANDRDPRNRTLRVARVGQPSVGTLVSNADGTYTYTPPPGYAGPVTFSYTIEGTGPVIASPGTYHYYEFVSAPNICWTDARTAAAARTYEGMQGYLATITFAGEKDFLAGRTQGQYWFGASDAAVEGEWRWQTGPEAGTLIWRGGPNGIGAAYANWSSGQPDDFKNEFRPQGEDYAQLYGNSGLWNDVDNCNSGGTTAGYVVEYGGLEACTPILYSLGTVTLEVNSLQARGSAQANLSAQASLAAAPTTTPAVGRAQLLASPNPSAGQFRVQVKAGLAGPAQLDLFDLQGRRVRSLYSGSLLAGELREVSVDAQELSAGLYLLRLQSGQQVQHLRVILQK